MLFAFFTATILWMYALQFTVLWDLWSDWELSCAVAWARDRLVAIGPAPAPVNGAPAAAPRGIAASAGQGGGVGQDPDADDAARAQAVAQERGTSFALRMRVLAGRGFPPFAQLRAMSAEIFAWRLPMRMMQAVPLAVAVM